MYKVVLIDDEPIIVEGLAKSIKWEEWNCQVVGMAYDGEEGMQLIREQQPHMIISDIHMPQMDGLHMIAGLSSEFPDMQITIMTGYREFEYAQEAIRLGVTRFLLKPSKMEEIKEAISAMTQKLQEIGVSPDQELKSHTNNGEAEETENESGEYNNAASSFIVKNATEYIEAHFREKLRLSDVADQIYVSQWHLSKLLNRYLGQSFSELLNHVRIEEAKKLLADPSLRIGDISEQVGFLDLAHFSRVFKKQEGISANAYRNKILGK